MRDCVRNIVAAFPSLLVVGLFEVVVLLAVVMPLSAMQQFIVVPPVAVNEAEADDNKPVDDEDPFAKVVKFNAGFAEHVKQIRRGIEWTFGGDLTFAATVCQSTPAEKQHMKRLAQGEIRAFFESAADQLMLQIGGQPRPARKRQQEDNAHLARQQAVERILTAVYGPQKENGQGPPPQLQHWSKEFALREQFLWKANAQRLVSILDERLLLEPKQRTVLTESLAASWDPSWDYYLEIIVQNPQFFPPVPNDIVRPHITDAQFKIWQGMSKQRLGVVNWQISNNQSGFFRNHDNLTNEWFSAPLDGQTEAVANDAREDREMVADKETDDGK